MNWKTAVELIGYLGSALVVISMLMTSVVRLRVINLIGSAIFTCYALLIKSYEHHVRNQSCLYLHSQLYFHFSPE